MLVRRQAGRWVGKLAGRQEISHLAVGYLKFPSKLLGSKTILPAIFVILNMLYAGHWEAGFWSVVFFI